MIKRIINNCYYLFEIVFINFPFFIKLYIKFHEFSVLKEIELADISKFDKVLHIGCGAIPYTSIVIARETKAKVIGIDNKQSIVNIATFYINKYNLTNNIEIKLGDGRDFDVSDFDVFVISYGVTFSDLILKQIFSSMNNKARIILRRSKEKYDNNLESSLMKYLVCSKNLLLNQESVLFVKKV